MQNLIDREPSTSVLPNAPEGSILAIRDLKKSFGRRQALRGISFEIKAQQQIALLGPNGAGKTTLVRSICGRCKPDSGVIELFGKPITAANAMETLGVVPQELAIYGDLTAKENLQIFGKLHGLRGSALKDRVEWALNWIGLSDRRNSLTKTFSGGMKRRVNIACGVLHAPRLLLLDEPNVGVDPQSRQRIFEMCDELVAEGTTIVLTTHQLEEAQTRCDRIVIIDHGQVVADGSLEQLIDSTIGNAIQLTFLVEGLPATAGTAEEAAAQNHFYATSDDPSTDIPRYIEEIEQLGGSVIDMQMQRSDLNQVFLHLTGRELRE